MINYHKLEKAVIMMLDRDIELAGYSKMSIEQLNEDGTIKEDTNLRLNYYGRVIRIYDDSIFVFAFNNGWIFSYQNWFKKDKSMKKFVKSELKRIQKAYDEQVEIDDLHLKNKYSAMCLR